MGVAAAGIEVGELTLEDALLTAGAHTPFFMNNATLLVDFSLFEEQTARPVGQDVEAGVYVVALDGDVVDVVDRFVGGGVGVEVLTELHTDALTILDELTIGGEVLGTIESHVFEEVCKTALAVFFLHRTHLLGDVEVGQSLRLGIVADVVGQAIRKLAVAHCRVHRERGHLLCRCGKHKGSNECEQKEL